MEWFHNILLPILLALIPSAATLIGTLAGVHVQIKKLESDRKSADEARQARQEEVLKCLLRTALLNMYFKHIEKQNFKLTQWEAENMHKMFTSYRALEGNSFVVDLVTRMNSWDVVQN
jgi:hypothetical protein